MLDAGTTIQELIAFANWRLDFNFVAGTIPEGYTKSDVITGISSSSGLEKGETYGGMEVISDLVEWKVGSRYLVACSNNWNLARYAQNKALCQNIFLPVYWKEIKENNTGLAAFYNTDLKIDDIPIEYFRLEFQKVEEHSIDDEINKQVPDKQRQKLLELFDLIDVKGTGKLFARQLTYLNPNPRPNRSSISGIDPDECVYVICCR